MRQLTFVLALVGAGFVNRDVSAQQFGYVPPGFGGSFYGFDVGGGFGIGYGPGIGIPYQALSGSVTAPYIGEQCCWDSFVVPPARYHGPALQAYPPLPPKAAKPKKQPPVKQVKAKKPMNAKQGVAAKKT